MIIIIFTRPPSVFYHKNNSSSLVGDEVNWNAGNVAAQKRFRRSSITLDPSCGPITALLSSWDAREVFKTEILILRKAGLKIACCSGV